MTKPSIFIASTAEGLTAARALQTHLSHDAMVTIWTEGVFSVAKPASESLLEIAEKADFAVYVLSPADLSSSRLGKTDVRANVYFELGVLIGRMGRSRVFLVVLDPGKTRLPSDLAGTVYFAVNCDSRLDLVIAVEPAAEAIRRELNRIRPRQPEPFPYFSCFISYSWTDKAFVSKLYDDLTEVGISCWMDAKDLQIGDKIADHVERAIQSQDRVLLVLSRASIKSPWLRYEYRHALKLEEERHRTVLFPLSLDESILSKGIPPSLAPLRERLICDFSGWESGSAYKRAFSSLVRDLTISSSVEFGGTT